LCQWLRNGVPAGPAGEWLTISAMQAFDAGEYSLVATNASGSVRSENVRVTVVPPEYRGEQPYGFAWTGRDATIPEQGGGLRAEIAVAGNFIAGRIRIHITLRHEALDHLRLTLLPPPALALPPVPLLRTGDGSRGRDLDAVTFAADAPPFSTSPWPHTGTWQPDDAAALRNLANLPANGTWTLVVEDTSAFDGFTGTLTAWMLEFRRPAPVPAWSSWQSWRGLPAVPGGDADGNGRNDLTDYMLAADSRGPIPDFDLGSFHTTHRRWIDGGLVHRYEVSADLQHWDVFVPPAGGTIRYPDGTELLTLQPPQGYHFLRAIAMPLPGQFAR
jgi:subtilisin-like proprotein convertase family protein